MSNKNHLTPAGIEPANPDYHLQHFTLPEEDRTGDIRQWRQFDGPTLPTLQLVCRHYKMANMFQFPLGYAAPVTVTRKQ